MSGVMKTRMARIASYLLGSIACAALGTVPVLAQTEATTAGQTYNFNIPSKSLAGAIADLGAVSGWRIAYPFTLPATTRSKPISGRLSPAQALSQLLAGTGISFRMTGPQSVVLIDTARAASPDASADGAIALDTIEVQGESAWGPVQGLVATRSATGSKTDAALIEIPQSISVVTPHQIAIQGAQNLEQALTYTPGAVTGSYGSNPEQDYVFLRGFAAPLFIDGVRQYKDYIVGAQLGFEPYGFERIEVLRGPASVLYGQVAPGGIVNQITKRPLETPFREMQLQGGNDNRFQGTFDFSGPIDKEGQFLYRLTGLGRIADGQMDFQGDDRLFLAPALTWKPNPDTRLTILSQVQRDRDALRPVPLPVRGTLRPNPNGQLPTGRFLGEPDFDAFRRDQYLIGYEFEHRFNDTWQVKQNLRYSYVDQLENFSIPYFDGSFLTDQRTVDRDAWSNRNKIGVFTVDNQLKLNLQTGPVSHSLLFGLDYIHVNSDWTFAGGTLGPIDAFNPIYGSPVGPLTPSISELRRESQTGVYVQDLIKLDRWRFTLGGRYDWADGSTTDRMANTRTDQSDKAFTGRVGVTYLFDTGLAPYASYATSFEPTTGLDSNSNPFKPTTGEQFEAGVKYQPDGSKSFIGVSAFQITKQNILTRAFPDDPADFSQAQIGEARVRGFEAEAKLSVTPGLSILGAYTFLESEITKAGTGSTDIGRPLYFTPKHQFSIWGDYEIQHGSLDGLAFGAGIRFRGPTWGLSYEIETPSFTLVDASIRYDLGKLNSAMQGVQLSIAARNLFDTVYLSNCSKYEGCFYGDRRQVLATMRYRW